MPSEWGAPGSIIPLANNATMDEIALASQLSGGSVPAFVYRYLQISRFDRCENVLCVQPFHAYFLPPEDFASARTMLEETGLRVERLTCIGDGADEFVGRKRCIVGFHNGDNHPVVQAFLNSPLLANNSRLVWLRHALLRDLREIGHPRILFSKNYDLHPLAIARGVCRLGQWS
jgi:hypothetical protein